MGKGKYKTDDEIRELLKKYETISDLRANDMSLYQLARRKGFLDELKSNYFKRTDHKKIIEWIKTFETRSDIRSNNNSLYCWCLRNGFDIYFPPRQKKYREKPVKEKLPLIEKLPELSISDEQYRQLESFVLNIKLQNYMATKDDVLLLQLLYYIYYDVRPNGGLDNMLNKQFYRIAKLYKMEKDRRLIRNEILMKMEPSN